MDGDTKPTKENNVSERHESNASNVFSTLWVRLLVQIDYGLQRFLLGGRYCFLLYIRIFLFILYLVLKKAQG
jgi:hypothetical protein